MDHIPPNEQILKNEPLRSLRSYPDSPENKGIWITFVISTHSSGSFKKSQTEILISHAFFRYNLQLVAVGTDGGEYIDPAAFH